MKYLSIFIAASLLISCDLPPVSPAPSNSLIKKDSISTSEKNLQTAKMLADSIFHYVELTDMRKITKRQLKKKADPWQKSQDSLRKFMNPYHIKQLDDYRTMLVSEMVDRKVIRDKQ